jgi:NAD(P)-dependent dehydrogenase (short-subunit alcohol dehydrogenase family)
MTQSFVGTREQVLSALMHAIKTVSGDDDGILDCGRFARFAHATVIRRGSLSIVTLTVLLTDYDRGLVIWVSSSSVRGGTPPYLAAYFAAKAAMDSLAVSYAGELARWGIETAIIVPGAFTKGTNHFVHSGSPADKARAAEYNEGPYAGVAEQALTGLASLEPADADVRAVAEAIVKVVDLPFGKRPT